MLITIRVLGVELVISVLGCYLILNFNSCVEKIPFKYYFGQVLKFGSSSASKLHQRGKKKDVGETVPLLRQLS